MLFAALLVLGGLVLLTGAVAAFEDQAADLDPSETRAAAAAYRLTIAGAWAAIGLMLFLLGGLIYFVSTIRTRRRRLARPPMPRVAAALATALLVLLGAFTVSSPDSPVLVGASLAMGGRGPASTVMYEAYQGELTGGTIAGQSSAENVHNFSLAGHTRGIVRMKMGSGGGGVGTVYAVSILEAQDGVGGWREVARTKPASESTVDVPDARYDGDLRVRVQVAEGGAGQVKYLVGISFVPTDDD